MTDSNRVPIGPHEVRYEPDTGYIFVTQIGVLDAQQAKELLAACSRFVGPNEMAFMLADDRQASGITPEARKIMSSSGGVGAQQYLAIFGASFGFRVIANLLFKAMSLSTPKMKTVMVSDEAEARAWLEKQKRRHR